MVELPGFNDGAFLKFYFLAQLSKRTFIRLNPILKVSAGSLAHQS